MNNKFSTKQCGLRFEILSNLNYNLRFGNFPFLFFLKAFSTRNDHLISSLPSCYFQQLFASILGKKTFACSRKKKKIYMFRTWKSFSFFWGIFHWSSFVEMKRLKSFFLSSMVVLAVINKTFFFEKVACSENEAWTKKFLLRHFCAKICCSMKLKIRWDGLWTILWKVPSI